MQFSLSPTPVLLAFLFFLFSYFSKSVVQFPFLGLWIVGLNKNVFFCRNQRPQSAGRGRERYHLTVVLRWETAARESARDVTGRRGRQSDLETLFLKPWSRGVSCKQTAMVRRQVWECSVSSDGAKDEASNER